MMIEPRKVVPIPTGIAIEIPSGFECQIRSRSGIVKNHSVFVINSPGTVDSDFRGELNVLLANFGDQTFLVEHGDRVAQLIFSAVPDVELVETERLSQTKRGDRGLGSTGKN
jgi:dUTP pyrophosphatase